MKTLWDAVKGVIKGKLVAVSAHIGKKKYFRSIILRLQPQEVLNRKQLTFKVNNRKNIKEKLQQSTYMHT